MHGNSHRFRLMLAIAFVVTFSVFKTNGQAIPKRSDAIQQRSYDQILIRHKRNYDFYRRVLSFSRLSWASPYFLDRGSAKGWYILSADISPHFNIGGERLPVVFQLTPRYMVRIFRNNEKFNDTSLPVRTPSYLPGATFYFPVSKKTTGSDYNWYRDFNYMSVAFFHHSNGQDGPEFLDDGTINLQNGNFSTNFFEANFHFSQRNSITGSFSDACNGDEDCAKNEMPLSYLDLYGKLGIEQHINTSDEIREHYGRTRVNFNLGFVRTHNARMIIRKNKRGKIKAGSQIEIPPDSTIDILGKLLHTQKESESCQVVGKCYQKEYVRFVLNTSFVVNRLAYDNSLARKINADLAMFLRVSGNNTAWFLMAGYYGSDPYNIYFQQSYWFCRTGIALGFFNYTNKFQYD